MATRKTTTTKTADTKTTGGTTDTKTTVPTPKITKTPNALSTSTTNDSTEAITTALKQVQQSLVSLREEVETLKATVSDTTTKKATDMTINATGFVTEERMDSLLTIIDHYAVWSDGYKAHNSLNKWKQGKI